MTTKDNKMLVLFLETLKQELKNLAETLKSKIVKRSELNNVFVFKIAGEEEKMVIHEMVNEIVQENGAKLDTGQNSLESSTDANQVSDEADGIDRGKAKTYATSQFHSDDEAA